MATPLYLLAVLAFAQDFELKDDDDVANSDGPKAVAYVTQEAAQATLKKFTDDLPGFAEPIALTKLPADHYQFDDFKSDYAKYRDKFMWYEGIGLDGYLTPEMLHAALVKNAPGERGGLDPAAAGRWMCNFAAASRGYFSFYNYTTRPEEMFKLHGTQAQAVEFSEIVLNKLTDRFKDVTKVDLQRSLHYHSMSECVSKTEEQLKTELPKEEKPVVKKEPVPPGEFTGAPGHYYVNTSKGWYEYWRWSDEGLKSYVACVAPIWAGRLIVETTAAQGKEHPVSMNPGGRELRAPSQPQVGKRLPVPSKAEVAARHKLCSKWRKHPDHKTVYGR